MQYEAQLVLSNGIRVCEPVSGETEEAAINYIEARLPKVLEALPITHPDTTPICVEVFRLKKVYTIIIGDAPTPSRL